MYNVEFESETCTCRLWQLTGVPCLHAVSALARAGEDPYMYVSKHYEVDTYHKVYESAIYGINGADLWGNSMYIPPLPPNFGKKNKGGRPGKARRKDGDEKDSHRRKKQVSATKLKRNQGKLRCGTCGIRGHNARRCPVNRPGFANEERAGEEREEGQNGGNPPTEDENDLWNEFINHEEFADDIPAPTQPTQDPLSQVSYENNIPEGSKKLKVILTTHTCWKLIKFKC